MARTHLFRVRRGQRGATLVEYVLLVSVLALATLGGLSIIEDGAEQATESTAERISSRTIPEVPPGGGDGGGGDPPPTPTSSTTSTTSTTAAPTTTTTTAAPTTTTSTTTTTAAPAKTLTVSWSDTSTQSRYGEWRATGSLRFTDEKGQNVSGASATVRAEYLLFGYPISSGDVSSGASNWSGRASVESSWISTGGWIPVTQVRFTVVSASAPGRDWDQDQASTTVTRP